MHLPSPAHVPSVVLQNVEPLQVPSLCVHRSPLVSPPLPPQVPGRHSQPGFLLLGQLPFDLLQHLGKPSLEAGGKREKEAEGRCDETTRNKNARCAVRAARANSLVAVVVLHPSFTGVAVIGLTSHAVLLQERHLFRKRRRAAEFGFGRSHEGEGGQERRKIHGRVNGMFREMECQDWIYGSMVWLEQACVAAACRHTRYLSVVLIVSEEGLIVFVWKRTIKIDTRSCQESCMRESVRLARGCFSVNSTEDRSESYVSAQPIGTHVI